MRGHALRISISGLVFLVSLFAIGCGSNNPSSNQPSSAIRVSISPSSATVAPTLTKQFSATVSNSSNAAVTWQVNGTTGGNATFGTIDGTGLYTAPATAPNARGTVVVEAVSVADPTKMAGATVGIGISVTVSPSSPVLQVGKSLPFSATVNATDPGTDQSVAWSVNNVSSGSSY